ncbi:MAG: ROK family protein [Cellvibrionales bacterium]|nr:ROK family protein [Cellvibrionales bacterium]
MADAAQKRIGVDLGGTKIEAAVIAADNRVLWRERVPTPSGDYHGTLRAIQGLVERAVAENSLSVQLPVGIGVPGSQSPRTGLMRGCNSTALNDKPLLHDVQAVLARPVRLANDADCFALSEACAGVGREAGTVFGAILGTGVGGGVVVHKQLLSGPNHNAGEWGHNAMPGNSVQGRVPRRCFCGRDNCIETWLSGTGLGNSFREAGLDVQNTQAGIELMRKQDPVAQSVWSDYVQLLARALSVVINIIDPDVVVLGGGVSNVDELYRDVPALWEQWIFSDVVRTRLLKAECGDSSGVIGAAWLWS